MQSFKENLRLVALVAVIVLGIAAQSTSQSEAGPGGFAKSGEEMPHWVISPVTVDILAPYLG